MARRRGKSSSLGHEPKQLKACHLQITIQKRHAIWTLKPHILHILTLFCAVQLKLGFMAIWAVLLMLSSINTRVSILANVACDLNIFQHALIQFIYCCLFEGKILWYNLLAAALTICQLTTFRLNLDSDVTHFILHAKTCMAQLCMMVEQMP